MITTITIARREFKNLINNPAVSGVIFLCFFFISIILFVNAFSSIIVQDTPTIKIFSEPILIISILIVPFITLRSIILDKKNGMQELTLTSCVKEHEYVLGKWFGIALFFSVYLILSIFYALILNKIITPGIDWGMLVSNYFGIGLIGLVMISVAMTMALLLNNTYLAIISTYTILVVLWGVSDFFINRVGYLSIISYIDLKLNFFTYFFNGVFELHNVIYLLSLVIFNLYCSALYLRSKKV